MKPLVPYALLAAALSAPFASAQVRELSVAAGKSIVVDSPVNIQRVAVADPKMAEAVAINPREVLINGLAAGETSLILWQQGGSRLVFDLRVRATNARMEALTAQLRREFPGESVEAVLDNDAIFLRGTLKDLNAAERAVNIAKTVAPVVNLLHVATPAADTQVLLKVKFANVDRAASLDLGANIFSTGAFNTPGVVTTGQFSPPVVTIQPNETRWTIGDALNVYLFRRDLNLGATVRALQSKRLLEILAEPNVLAMNNKPASFVAGGEFPFPTLQGGGGGLGAVTIQFREFGVRLNFTPSITPRGTIRLVVNPEVSSLDFANGLVFQGFNIPALATRRVVTEVELDDGQSFAIAGLMDNRLTDTLVKIPGLANIPLLGKLFQTKSTARNKSELLVLVTPEIVRPIAKGVAPPAIEFPKEFMKEGAATPPRTPGMEITGPVPVEAAQPSMPVEQLIRMQSPPAQQAAPQMVPMLPVPWLNPAQPQGGQPAAPAPAASAGAGPSGREAGK